MKLKNKLLPLVGVATACAAVAPIALTSCTSNNNGNWVDLMTKYTPSVKALDNQTATTTEANKLYFGNETDGWKSDEDVIAQFKDDYCWSLYNEEGNTRQYAEAKVKFDYFYVNHVTFTPSTYWSGTKDPYKIVTFTYKAEFQGTYSYSTERYTNTYTYNCTNTVTNVPFAVWYNTFAEDPTWFITQDTKLIADNDFSTAPIAWSVNEDVNYTATYSYPEYGFESTNTYTNEAKCYTNCYSESLPEASERDYMNFFSVENGSSNNSLMVPVGATSHYMFSVQHSN